MTDQQSQFLIQDGSRKRWVTAEEYARIMDKQKDRDLNDKIREELKVSYPRGF